MMDGGSAVRRFGGLHPVCTSGLRIADRNSGPPNRRTAEPPSFRTAEPPSFRNAEPPNRRAALLSAMWTLLLVAPLGAQSVESQLRSNQQRLEEIKHERDKLQD